MVQEVLRLVDCELVATVVRERLMEAFIYSVAGIIIGGLITFFVSRHYYQRASEELRSEAEKLRTEVDRARKHTKALITYLEGSRVIPRVPTDAQHDSIEQQNIGVDRVMESDEEMLPPVTEQKDPPTDTEREG